VNSIYGYKTTNLMSKKKRLFWYSFFGVIILMQAYPVVQPEVQIDNPNDLLVNVEVSNDIAVMLKSSCYDCHSNETKWPWYSRIAPGSFLITRDVVEGRKHVNFSEFSGMNSFDSSDIADEILDVLEGGDMPLFPYLLLHPGTSLSDSQTETLMEWARTLYSE